MMNTSQSLVGYRSMQLTTVPSPSAPSGYAFPSTPTTGFSGMWQEVDTTWPAFMFSVARIQRFPWAPATKAMCAVRLGSRRTSST